MAEHRVLMIAYYFPPLGGAGVQRTVKFVKYLPQFGWQPHVLTAWASRYYTHDASLSKDLPADLPVSRAFAWNPILPSARLNRLISPLWRWILTPDSLASWLPGGARLGARVLREADRVISPSPPITEDLMQLVPDQPAAKFATIYNGYDPEDWAGQPEYARSDKFTVTYTGSLYGDRNAGPFLDALGRLLGDGSLPRERIEIQFVGNTGVKPEIERRGLGDVVQACGYRTHPETVGYQRQADLLLLILPTSGGEGAVSGKIFEYLGSGRPILALVPPGGAAAGLIREAGAGFIVPPEDVDAIAGALRQMYEAWTAGRWRETMDRQVIGQYDRRFLTGRLAGYFDALIGEGKT
jgi:glycosyltransferase involved in cell wall biosynthesis